MREQLEEDIGELLESGFVAEFAQKQEELEASAKSLPPQTLCQNLGGTRKQTGGCFCVGF